ncbi:MAG: Bax inhibitor-1 family protein [Gammaproteobacteria bacterium]|nr:Bax inhibitor-1 family protein [Gammaproteobacteria bacterium]NVK87368.1 Bax inhibitor-1 family protein [Gammaproteobacteria bacterium]
MDNNVNVIDRSHSRSIEINKVLKNTYLLVAASLLVCAGAAGVAMAMNIAPISPWLYLIVIFGMSFVMAKTANSGLGIVMMFLFAGFLGFYAGPIINYYVASFGSEVVVQSLGLTALIFFGLSGYVLKTGKDFTFMRGFLFTGTLVVVGLALIYFVGQQFAGWHVSGLSLAISAAMVLLISGYILYDTSSIMRGEQTNYILAAMSVFINIYVLFMNILHLVSAFSGDD